MGNTDLAQTLKQQVEFLLQRTEAHASLEQINQQILHLCRQFFPKQPRKTLTPSRDPATRAAISEMWTAHQRRGRPLPPQRLSSHGFRGSAQEGS